MIVLVFVMIVTFVVIAVTIIVAITVIIAVTVTVIVAVAVEALSIGTILCKVSIMNPLSEKHNLPAGRLHARLNFQPIPGYVVLVSQK